MSASSGIRTDSPATLAGCILFLALTLAGCAASREAGPDETRPGQRGDRPSKAPLSVYEATLNPSDFDEDTQSIRTEHAETPQTPLELPEDSSYVEEEEVQGFRIQIFSSPSIDEANSVKAAAAEAFPRDSIHVVYDPPVYKVRLGDFVERMDANRKLSQVIQSQYPDAWIVSDRVLHRRIVRVLSAPGAEPKN